MNAVSAVESFSTAFYLLQKTQLNNGVSAYHRHCQWLTDALHHQQTP